ncbi:MAG: acyl-CoA carboxylase subunit beta [Elusimicrobia bacterium]|nr:acyl-CoA carboxylase subunit beta [Elusimicrobiota bacterium]
MEETRKTKGLVPAKTQDLVERRKRAMEGGGPEKVAQQRQRGKMLARERIAFLLDEDSFEEMGLLIESKCDDFGMAKERRPGDGVVAGFGRIHGRGVCVYAQDFTVIGGTLGLAHARKICSVLELAAKAKVPVVALCDSGGARIQEGVESLGGYADIFYRNVQLSGFVPQITAILGPCAGGAVYSPALTDFVFMVEGLSRMFVTGPDVIRASTGESTDLESLGGAKVHASKSGACHFLAGSEHDCFRQIRELLEYLPQSCEEKPKPVMPSDDPFRLSPQLGTMAEMDPKKPYNIHDVILEIADNHQFLETHRDFALNLVTGFIRLNGESVGVVANNPLYFSGALDVDASEKGARFVRFCDAFNIPLLTLVDVPGYWPGVEQEHGGLIRRGAKLLYAYCQSTVPKVAVVLRKAYGGAYDVMSSKHVKGDVNLAWPCAEIAVMGPQAAVEVLHKDALAAAPDSQALRDKLIAEYVAKFASPYEAARRGYIDEVIDAKETRPKIIRAFQFLRGKSVEPVKKKHGNIPL